MTSKASRWIVLNSEIHLNKKYKEAWDDLGDEILFNDIQKAVENKNWQFFHDTLIRAFEAIDYTLLLRVMIEAQKEYGRFNKEKEEYLSNQISSMTKTTADFVSLFDLTAEESELAESLSNRALELQNRIAEVELLLEKR